MKTPRYRNSSRHLPLITCILIASDVLVGRLDAAEGKLSTTNLRASLTFFAGFDAGPDAGFALGDRRIYSAASIKQPREGTAGLPGERAS
jgi:hypothetical protein